MSDPVSLTVARPKRLPSVLICAKCLKKADDGRRVRKALKAGLAERAKAAGRRPGKLVETKCMGLCPKQAATLASGASLTRGELLVARRAADVPAALDLLLD